MTDPAKIQMMHTLDKSKVADAVLMPNWVRGPTPTEGTLFSAGVNITVTYKVVNPGLA